MLTEQQSGEKRVVICVNLHKLVLGTLFDYAYFKV